jgi:hypothetical protein
VVGAVLPGAAGAVPAGAVGGLPPGAAGAVPVGAPGAEGGVPVVDPAGAPGAPAGAEGGVPAGVAGEDAAGPAWIPDWPARLIPPAASAIDSPTEDAAPLAALEAAPVAPPVAAADSPAAAAPVAAASTAELRRCRHAGATQPESGPGGLPSVAPARPCAPRRSRLRSAGVAEGGAPAFGDRSAVGTDWRTCLDDVLRECPGRVHARAALLAEQRTLFNFFSAGFTEHGTLRFASSPQSRANTSARRPKVCGRSGPARRACVAGVCAERSIGR